MNCGITLVSESVPDHVTAVIFAGFFSGTIFVVSILVSTRALFRKCCPTQRAADGWESARFWGFGLGLGWIPFFNPLSPTSG